MSETNNTRATFKHGALATPATPHIPMFGNFITGTIKKNVFDWSRNSAMWPDLGNKKIGDCVVAGAMHYTQAVTSYCNRMVVATESEAIATLTELNGFDPKATLLPNGENPTDVGVNVSDMLTKWITAGFTMRAQIDRIVTAVRIDPSNIEHLKLAGVVFGGLLLVVDLPLAAQNPDEPWDTPVGGLIGEYKPGSWGRHCVYCPVIDDSGGSVITWGESQPFEWGWWLDYGLEAWAVMHPAWFASGKTVSGYNYDAAICAASNIRAGA